MSTNILPTQFLQCFYITGPREYLFRVIKPQKNSSKLFSFLSKDKTFIRALRCTCGRHIVVECQEDIYVTEVFDYKCQQVYRLQENM